MLVSKKKWKMNEIDDEILRLNKAIAKKSLEKRKQASGIANTIVCARTGRELFNITKSGKQEVLASYGQCYECKQYYATEELYFPSGFEHQSWLIVYKGTCCMECYKKT